MFTVKQDVSIHAFKPTLTEAIQVAQEWIATVDNPTTFTVENDDGEVVASETNRRIIGTFTKQVWVRDYAQRVEDEEFDATDAILAMPLAKIQALVARDTSTDDVGKAHVDWDGPHEVEILDAICAFFGVEDLADITLANLEHVRTRHAPTPKTKKTVLLTISVTVDAEEGVDIGDFVSECDYSVRSKSAGAKVIACEIREFVEA